MNKKAFGYILLIAAISAAGSYLYWYNFLRYDSAAESVKQYQEAEKRYIEAMTADTYGGKTPQETLDMFVDALRNGDIDLASKYFMLDENLSREKWVTKLIETKTNGSLERMINLLKESKPDSDDSIDSNDFKYVLIGKDSLAMATINFKFNTYSQTWKIENL